jgi:hypothetical protein
MSYVFDPQVLQSVARGALHLPMAEKVAAIREELARLYPGHVQEDVEWIYNIAGGAMGQMAVLHASITEYVIIFGSPIGTEGYSGRFAADDYFIILEGEQWAFAEGEFERQVAGGEKIERSILVVLLEHAFGGEQHGKQQGKPHEARREPAERGLVRTDRQRDHDHEGEHEGECGAKAAALAEHEHEVALQKCGEAAHAAPARVMTWSGLRSPSPWMAASTMPPAFR